MEYNKYIHCMHSVHENVAHSQINTKLWKRIRATPCFFYFLFVDFNLGKIDFNLGKIDFNLGQTDFTLGKIDFKLGKST